MKSFLCNSESTEHQTNENSNFEQKIHVHKWTEGKMLSVKSWKNVQ